MGTIVRPAVLEDARAIAAIHVQSWQLAYQGIVPAAFLASLSIEEREGVWAENLQRMASKTWVADEGGKVVGWISAARSRDSDALPSTGEVWAIYVDPWYWRRGVGGLLLVRRKGNWPPPDFRSVTLWVLKENTRAIRFYEAHGLVIEPGSGKTITRSRAEQFEVRLRKRLDS